MQLSDSERHVMDVIWDKQYSDEKGEIIAKKVSDILIEKFGWNKTSNYIYFNRLLTKGVIDRRYPNYTIKPLITKDQMANMELEKIISKTYDGSSLKFFSAFLRERKFGEKELKEMKDMIEAYESENAGK